MTSELEAGIIKRVLNGDCNAFSTIVDMYQKNVYNLALRMTGNPEDAQDMAQEAFIKAYKNLSSFRGDSKFSVWLYRIVSNVCLDFLRSKKRKPTVSICAENEEGEETEIELPDFSALPEEELERRLTREAVCKGLSILPSQQKEILLMREIQGMSYEEIGDALSIEAGTVKSRIFRARKKLCAYLLADGNIPDEFSSDSSKGGAEA